GRPNSRLMPGLETNRQSGAQLMAVEAAFDRIHAVLHSLAEAVVVIDAGGNVVLANPAARALMESGGRPVEGQSLAQLLTEPLSGTVLDLVARCAADESAETFVVCGRQAFDVDVRRMTSRSGASGFGHIVTIRDETTRHDVARLKDEILSSVSHELRTPLTNVLAFAELLGTLDPTASEWGEFVRIVRSEAERMSGIVENVLEYTQLESGGMPWAVEEFDVAELLCGLAAQWDGTPVLVLLEGTNVPRRVSGDRAAVHRVVVHLLDNARKFTPEDGQIALEVEDAGGMVRVAVHDSGPGVPDDDRERVFDRLSQLGD